MTAVQHERSRIEEEVKSLVSCERILSFLNRLMNKEKSSSNFDLSTTMSTSNSLSNFDEDSASLSSVVEWESFARLLSRLYTLLNANVGELLLVGGGGSPPSIDSTLSNNSMSNSTTTTLGGGRNKASSSRIMTSTPTERIVRDSSTSLYLEDRSKTW
jgi:hypothetical protein